MVLVRREEGFLYLELKKVVVLVKVFKDVKKCINEEMMKGMILEYYLVWEYVLIDLLKLRVVWEVLMRYMLMMVMIRNLGKMFSFGLLEFDSFGEFFVEEKLKSKDLLKLVRIYFFILLVVYKVYFKG